MLSLIKIKTLKNYRFYEDYQWDEFEELNTFAKTNLIYGWNGSGKTTICDFFKALENRAKFSDGEKFELLFQDEAKVSTSIDDTSPYKIDYSIRVFNQDYIADNISTPDNIKHIYVIGKENAEDIEKIKMLIEEKKRLGTEENILANKFTQDSKAFEKLKTDIASEIRREANLPMSYNKNVFFAKFGSLKNPKKSEIKDLGIAKKTIVSEPKKELPIFVNDFIRPDVEQYIAEILMEKPINKTIEKLKKNSELSSWVESGFNIHKSRNESICEFCGNLISQERFNELENHFNTSFIELNQKIDNAINNLNMRKKQYEDFIESIFDESLIYPEFIDSYRVVKEQSILLCKKNIKVIEKIIDVIEAKKKNIISDEYMSTFKEIIMDFDFVTDVTVNINEVINLNNNKSKDFDKAIKAARTVIEEHFIALRASEVKKAEFQVNNSKIKVEVNNASLKEINKKIFALEQGIKDSNISAEQINRDIAIIMGRDDIKFKNESYGYKIIRNGKVGKNLSKGEQNALALIYFFNSLKDKDTKVSESIIVLDDPISSFDANFYYNAISYIRIEAEKAGQVFVFTHKFSLYKDLCKMFEKPERYLLKRVSGCPKLMKESSFHRDYYDEYAYLFNEVLSFVKKGSVEISDYLPMGNIARKLLEGFLSFKIPETKDSIKKVEELEKEHSIYTRAMTRLLNNKSHFGIIPNIDTCDDIATLEELPQILREVLNFILKHDEKHFITLLKKCGEDPDIVIIDGVLNFTSTLPQSYTVPLYDLPASAGLGGFTDENGMPYKDFLVKQKCDFAVKIKGNSMEPKISDGCIVLVEKKEAIENGKIGIFTLNGNILCKRLVTVNGQNKLKSDNKDYPMIDINTNDVMKLWGQVIKII